MDFTLKIYKKLLIGLQNSDYQFISFREYCDCKPFGKFIILRHDIDKKPNHALRIAELENKLDIRSSFYFRIVSSIFKPDIISSIAKLNHEIGYHYSDLVDNKGNEKKAILSFESNLNRFRKTVPVKTIVMDGCPLSKYDNRDLWKSYDYHDFDIIGEPYFDIDFNQVFYLTDTGRCWDGGKFSVRDKVQSDFQQRYHSTQDIIDAAKNGSLPTQIMITTHPQRWTDNKLEWVQEYVMQGIKNFVKRILISS